MCIQLEYTATLNDGLHQIIFAFEVSTHHGHRGHGMNYVSHVRRHSDHETVTQSVIRNTRGTEILCSHKHTATQENQGSNRGTSEGGGRQKLKKVDGDFPACMRLESNNENNTRRNEDLKGKGRGRLKHHNVDGDVPLCLRNFDEENKNSSSSSKKNSKERDGARKQHIEPHEGMEAEAK